MISFNIILKLNIIHFKNPFLPHIIIMVSNIRIPNSTLYGLNASTNRLARGHGIGKN